MNLLDYAIKMEHDGEAFYREQAELNKDNSLFVVCNMLAEDEKNHALIIKYRNEQRPFELEDTDTLKRVRNVFSNAKDIGSYGDGVPDQLDFYMVASRMEKASIDLYSDLLSKSGSGEDRELYEFLIRQEEEHFRVLEELVVLLSHAEDWVENAEFGNRGEY